jgi:hypothetical protein
MFDGKAYGEGIVELVKGYVEREVAPLKAENENLRARIEELEARPAPEKGEKGDPGENGQDGRDGTDGQNGADGRGVKDLLLDREGNLLATMDDGSTKNLGPVCGKDGEPGKDGRDGFSLDNFDVQPTDERTLELIFEQGDRREIYELVFPVIIDKGVYKAGETYVRGDAVTWGGSLWIAQKETSEKPDGPDSGWRLAVKKGRDGKDAKNG